MLPEGVSWSFWGRFDRPFLKCHISGYWSRRPSEPKNGRFAPRQNRKGRPDILESKVVTARFWKLLTYTIRQTVSMIYSSQVRKTSPTSKSLQNLAQLREESSPVTLSCTTSAQKSNATTSFSNFWKHPWSTTICRDFKRTRERLSTFPPVVPSKNVWMKWLIGTKWEKAYL